jgi:hypothetical protein
MGYCRVGHADVARLRILDGYSALGLSFEGGGTAKEFEKFCKTAYLFIMPHPVCED